MALPKDQELKINSALYEAMMGKNDEEVVRICRGIPKGPLHIISMHGDTVLHMAIYQKKTNLSLRLLDMVSACDNHKLTWQNNGGNTILHETGTNSKTVKVAEAILHRAPMLLNMVNKEGETALFYAARHGKTDIYMFLHDEVCRSTEGMYVEASLKRDDKFTILHIAILSRNYRVAYDIAVNHKELIPVKDGDGMTALQLLSTINPKFHPKGLLKRMMFKLIDTDLNVQQKNFPFRKKLRKLKKEKHSCEWALNIALLLIKEDNSWEKTASWTNDGRTMSTPKLEQKISENVGHTASTPLLLATIHDSTEIAKEILNMYPQAVEHVDKEGHNILHLAILHRRYDIIDMVEEMEYPLSRLRGRVDNNYNTLLHMVGHKVDHLKEDIKHPAQELKEDQRLYKRVQKICTTLDESTRNADQKTPYEVFSEANDNTRYKAKEWMSENAKNCSIVAVLIATVAFTSAYTVPGGSSDTGHPVLKGKPMFLLFTLADAISLSTSLTSVIVFLNILTSPFHFSDFASNLFEKQLIALILLIISVAMMMVAFVATLILTISNQGTWSDMTLYGVTFFPVVIFVYFYISDYLNIVVDFYQALKKMVEKAVLGFHDIWDYKPKPTYPVNGTDHHFSSISPV